MPESLSAPSQLLGDWPVGLVQRISRLGEHGGRIRIWGAGERGLGHQTQVDLRLGTGLPLSVLLGAPGGQGGLAARRSPWILGGFRGVRVGVMSACLAPESRASLHSPS